MANTWAKMPIAWIRHEDKLRLFKVGDIGSSIAGLKIYMALVLTANFLENDEFEVNGCSAVSYTTLEALTGMSRALVASGIEKLKNVGLVVIHKKGRPNVYRLTGFNDLRGWAKLPKSYLYGSKRHGQIQKIAEFSMRHRAHLNGLRIYLLLHAFRNGRSAQLSYDKMTEYTGISRELIHPALSVLMDLQLISVSNDEAPETKYRNPNKYLLRGL